VDPPRIDQLLSQGYGVFGRIQELLEENEKTISEFLQELPKAISGITKFMKQSNWKNINAAIGNINALTTDIRVITKKFHTPEMQEVLDKLYKMVDRAYQVDRPALKKFMQEEGIRARIF